MSHVLFVIGIVAALLTINSFWPPRRPATLALAGFFANWLCTEAPFHIIAAELATAAVVIGLGGLEQPIGFAGLVLLVLAALGLAYHHRLAGGAWTIVEHALVSSLGRDYTSIIRAELGEDSAPTVTARQVAGFLPVCPPEVERFGVGVVYHQADGDQDDGSRQSRWRRRGRLRLTLDVYRHHSRPSNCPTFLYVHGGGWVIGNNRQQGLPLIHRLAARGWTCVTINYRLSPRATFPDHLIDVKRAIRWIRQNGRQYGANPDFLVIGGSSAGAHLAALAALTANDPEYQPDFPEVDTSVRGCVAFYGVYDFADEEGYWPHRGFQSFIERVVMKAKRGQAVDAYAKASPLYRIHANAPPFLLIHGSSDTLVPVAGARAFVARFTQITSSPITYIELPRTQHAFEVFPSLRSMQVIHGVERYLAYLYSRYLDEIERAA